MAFLTDLLNSALDLPWEFADVALQGPITAVLVALGFLFVALPVLAGGVLTLGALVDVLTPFRPAREHQP